MQTKSLYERYFKRLLDVFCSLLAIFVFSPLIIILAILIRCKLGSPIFFVQKRPGKNEQIFSMYKFRTMSNKLDKHGKLLPDNERMTKFGKILRSTSMDELPELWNILMGHMSFVGPRPLLVEYLELYNEQQKKRHLVRPGLTGLAQVNGRNAINWEKKFSYDIKYVENITFIGDLLIIFKTMINVFKREGITDENQATVEKFKGTKN